MKQIDSFSQGWWWFPAAAFTVVAKLYVKHRVISVEKKIGCHAHRVVACRAAFCWLAFPAVDARPAIFLHKVHDISTFHRSFLMTCIQPLFLRSTENNSGSPEAEVSLPCESVVKLFTFQEISIFTAVKSIASPVAFCNMTLPMTGTYPADIVFKIAALKMLTLVPLIHFYQWSARCCSCVLQSFFLLPYCFLQCANCTTVCFHVVNLNREGGHSLFYYFLVSCKPKT